MRTDQTMKVKLSKDLRAYLVFMLAVVCMTIAIIMLLMIQVGTFSIIVFVISKFIGIVFIVFAYCLFRALDIVN